MEPPTRAVPSALPPGMTREMRATSSATVVPIDAPAPARTPQPDPELCPATTTARRKLLRRAEKLILAEFAELFVPIQYMVFMVFAWYGYNRHAFNLGDSMANDHEFGVAILWVVALIMLDLLSTLLTIWAVQRSHNLSMVRVLAFAVKKHWWLLSNFVVLMYIFVISLALRHTGCDFSFKFEWM